MSQWYRRRCGGAAPLAGERREPTWAIIAGGGTAGHVVPAIAIGQALVARGHPAEAIHFVGSRRGIERRLVPEAGFRVTLLPGRGIARRFTLDNAAAVGGLLVALGQAVALVSRRRPSVVVSVGGYASVPCALAATVLRVPIVVAEQNAVPGAANRLAARVARASAVSFAGTRLPRAVLTGNPVRSEVLAVARHPAAREAARQALDLPPDAVVVAAFGGSLGARRINDAVLALAGAWRQRSGIAIRHVVGVRDWDEISAAAAALPGGAGLVYQQVRYEDRMDLVYAAADLAVCRAGASTVAELAAVGLGAILVPLPGAPGDHQTANAMALVTAGAAVLIADRDLNGTSLAEVLAPLLADKDRLAALSEAARRLGRPGAAGAVAQLVEENARDHAHD
jgi:UDP-N-acetylglucosamine--N-acetylmuramyl-(pentapeptide) pyrophosphoryl-undecaprenol N-acetylglucosamine transferase